MDEEQKERERSQQLRQHAIKNPRTAGARRHPPPGGAEEGGEGRDQAVSQLQWWV
jgi:hypothetical protein